MLPSHAVILGDHTHVYTMPACVLLSCSKPCVDTVLKPGLLAFPQFELQAPKITSLLFQETLGPYTRVLDWDIEKRWICTILTGRG